MTTHELGMSLIKYSLGGRAGWLDGTKAILQEMSGPNIMNGFETRCKFSWSYRCVPLIFEVIFVVHAMRYPNESHTYDSLIFFIARE